MTDKEKKRIRRWRRKHKGVVQSDEEILDLLSHSGRKSSSKSLISKDKIFVENEENKGYNVKIKFKSNPVCFVCNSTIDNFKEASWVVGSKGYGFYHRKKCGPGTQRWVKNHPTLISLLVFLQSKGMIGEGEGGDVFRDYKKWRRNLTNKKIVWSEGDVVMFLSYMKIREEANNQNKEDHTMSKKEKVEEKKKGGAGSGLVPKEPVQVPKELYKNKTIGKILEEMRDTDDPEVKRACRKQLRDNGFKLSDESTWKPFLKGGKAVKDEEDEEEEAPKKSKKDKKAEKKVDKKAEKKGKKAKIEEDEEDEDEEDEEDDD